MKKAALFLLPIGLSACVSVKSYDRLETRTIDGRTWTVARHIEESRHVMAECSSGTGSDVLEIALKEPHGGRTYVLPSEDAHGRSYWYFIPSDTSHRPEHAWQGRVTVLRVSASFLSLELDAVALHPESGASCRTYRRRMEIRPATP